MTKHEFHNALRILRCIDYREVSWMSTAQWVSFRDHPYEFVIRCDDDACDRIWAVIEARQAKSAAVRSAAAMRAEDDAEARKPDDHRHAEYLAQKAEQI